MLKEKINCNFTKSLVQDPVDRDKLQENVNVANNTARMKHSNTFLNKCLKQVSLTNVFRSSKM